MPGFDSCASRVKRDEKAGLPKIRDKDGGYDAAPNQAPVPEHIAGFVLHLAASNIVMLVQTHRALPVRQRS
jgi:hypothetical protein